MTPKIDEQCRRYWKTKRRKEMLGFIFGLLICIVGLAILIISMLKVHKQYEQDVEDGIIMVDLSDVESRHEEDTVTIEEWAEMTKQDKYEHDISESMPEVVDKLCEIGEPGYVMTADEIKKAIEYSKYKYLDISLSKELQRFCQDTCESYGLEYAFLLALMETESTFREDIGSEKILGGEEGGPRYYGYMQLSIENCIKARDYALDAHTPEGNIEMAVIILSGLMEDYDNDILMVTMAYKGGEGAAKSWQESGYVLPIAYTVLENYEKYKEMLK